MREFSNKLLAFLTLILLNSCTFSDQIQDIPLRDRVLSCSAGFSNDVQASLQGAYHKATLEGDIAAGLKRNSQSVIFSMLPPGDRLRAYEDYIQCIEVNQEFCGTQNLPHPMCSSTSSLSPKAN